MKKRKGYKLYYNYLDSGENFCYSVFNAMVNDYNKAFKMLKRHCELLNYVYICVYDLQVIY